MQGSVTESGIPTNITASTLITSAPTALVGIFVAQASATPTIKVWNNTAASGAVLVNTFTPVAGTWYPMPFKSTNGLFVTITGTVDCTVCWQG